MLPTSPPLCAPVSPTRGTQPLPPPAPPLYMGCGGWGGGTAEPLGYRIATTPTCEPLRDSISNRTGAISGAWVGLQ